MGLLTTKIGGEIVLIKILGEDNELMVCRTKLLNQLGETAATALLNG